MFLWGQSGRHLILLPLSQDTADYIRPISFSLRFKINDTESGPVLDEGWPTTVKKSVSSTTDAASFLHFLSFSYDTRFLLHVCPDPVL